MTKKITLILILFSILNLLYSSNLYSQVIDRITNNLERKVKQKTKEKENKAVKTITDPIENLIDGRNEKSLLKKYKLYQLKKFPEKSDVNTRVAIAENLLIDIEGRYPEGYTPKWKSITYESFVNFRYEDWIRPQANLKTKKMKFAIGDYQGKAVLMLGNSETCDCFADIEIKNIAVLTQEPQTFKVTSFGKIQNLRRTNQPCSSNRNEAGGWEGVISLSANKDGDIKINLVIESYETAILKKTAVAYRYLLEDFTILNEMSARKATEKVVDEIAAKKSKKDFIVKSEKQIAVLMKNILKKYPKDCSNCIERNQGMETDSRRVDYEDRHGNYVYSKTEYDASIRKSFGNSCNHKIKIIGIQQKHSQEKGYYYEEVARTMDANEKHEVKQGIFSYIFTALVGLQDDIYLQDKYCIECASVNSIQWIRVIRN